MLIILGIFTSIICTIFGTKIGLWIADNFSFYKVKCFFNKTKPKYLL